MLLAGHVQPRAELLWKCARVSGLIVLRTPGRRAHDGAYRLNSHVGPTYVGAARLVGAS